MTTLRIDVPARPSGDGLVVTPSRDEASAQAGTYRQVPLAHTYLDDLEISGYRCATPGRASCSSRRSRGSASVATR